MADEGDDPPKSSTDFERMSNIARGAPKAQLDSAASDYKVALSRYQDALEEIRNRQGLLAQRRSELALAKQQLADTIVYAPMDGVVQEKKASAGVISSTRAVDMSIQAVSPVSTAPAAASPGRHAESASVRPQAFEVMKRLNISRIPISL